MPKIKLTPFYTGLLAFLFGVFFADFLREYYTFFLPLLFLPIFYYTKISIKTIIASFLGYILGAGFLFFSLPDIENMQLVQKSHNTQNQEIFGYIKTFPKIKEDKLSFQLEVENLKNNTNEILLVTKFIKYSRNSEIQNLQYGDFIKIYGKLEEPQNSKNSNFDYKRFLAKDKIFTIMNNPQIYILPPPKTSLVREFWKTIFAYRIQFQETIQQKLSFPENEYALGITLGDESRIPPQIIQEFNDTGLRHLLALSGMNITIIILFLSSLFFFLPTPIRIATIAFSIIVFVILTGASSSVVRAAAMGIIGIIALHSGRKLDPFPLLILALFLITLWNPFLLFSDISLQFSVLAVLGLLYIEPLFHKISDTHKTKDSKQTLSLSKNILQSSFTENLKTVLTATISAQIAVSPLMIVFFEQVSIISPITNLLIVPISTLAMILVFATALPIIGWIFMIFAYGLLHITLIIAHIFAQIPHATINTENLFSFTSTNSHHIHIFQNLFIFIYYSILILLLIYLYNKKHTSN